MSIQDRTAEFHSVVSLVSRRVKRPASTKPYIDNPNGKRPRSEFARQAAEVGRSIADTMGKLERLAQLAHRKSIFDDRPVEVAELTYVIKQDLSTINAKISSLQAYSRSLQQDPSQPRLGPEAKEHAKNVVVLLQSNLSKATLSFKEILEVRTKNLQAGKARTEQFVSGVQSAAGSAIARSASPLYQPSPAGNTTTQSALSRRNIPANSASLSLEPPPDMNNPYGQSQQQLLMQEQDNSQAYISSRSEAIDTIERTINELGGIFSQLAEMVAVQGEQIQRIDEDVEIAGGQIEGAQVELMKFYRRVKNSRGLYIKMFGTLMIFFLLWVMVSG